jgi:hypothetical protein
MITEQHTKKYADLQIQAMLFNMDIDIETWSLVAKNNFKHPIWIEKWKEKQDNSDYQPDGSDDQEYAEDN